MREECVFCQIANGDAPASLVYEDGQVLAFMDAFPVNPGHALVIPREHAPYLADLIPEVGAQTFKAAMKVAAAIRETDIECEGMNLILADGKAAGQEIFHVHLHVIPRFPDDNFSMSSRTRRQSAREELDSLAERIREASH